MILNMFSLIRLHWKWSCELLWHFQVVVFIAIVISIIVILHSSFITIKNNMTLRNIGKKAHSHQTVELPLHHHSSLIYFHLLLSSSSPLSSSSSSYQFTWMAYSPALMLAASQILPTRLPTGPLLGPTASRLWWLLFAVTWHPDSLRTRRTGTYKDKC